MGTALRLAIAVLPGLAFAGLHGALGFALAIIAVVAAMHGWGSLVKRLARIDDAPAALVVHWGLAVMIGLGLLAAAVHLFGHGVQLAIVIAGVALHAVHVLRSDSIAVDRHWLIPAVGLALVATLHVLGAAGDITSSPFDDDGSLPAHLAQLWDTGSLAGVPHGGHVVASALITAVCGPSWFRVVDALGFALLLWLALAHLRPRGATGAIWAVLLIFVAASYPSVATDAVPRWLAASLVLALFVTFDRYAEPEDDRLLWPLGLLAGAIAAVRVELAPIAVAMVLAAGILGLGRSGGGRRMIALVAVPVVLVLPVVAVPTGFAVHLAIFVAVMIPATWVLARTFTGARRWIAIAAAAGIAGIATRLTGSQLMWPIVDAAVLALGLGALRSAAIEPRSAALILSLAAAVLIYDGRDVPGRVRWARRYTELASGIEYLRHAYPAPPPARSYDRLLAAAPAGTTVAVWVARPEELTYKEHRILDLRTPRTAARPAAALHALHPDYLLVEDDIQARRDLFFRLACTGNSRQAFCLDDLERIAVQHPPVASEGRIALIRLRP